VRHGETEDNKTRTIAGHNAGKLSALGVTQAQALASRLRDDGATFDAVYSSDLMRTRQTTEEILKQLPHATVPVHFDARLREKGAGSIEGRPLGTAEKMAKKNKVSMRDFRPPGGESWRDVAVRSQSFVREIVASVPAQGGAAPGADGGGAEGGKGGGKSRSWLGNGGGLECPAFTLKPKKGAEDDSMDGAGRGGAANRRAVDCLGGADAHERSVGLLGMLARKAAPLCASKARQQQQQQQQQWPLHPPQKSSPHGTPLEKTGGIGVLLDEEQQRGGHGSGGGGRSGGGDGGSSCAGGAGVLCRGSRGDDAKVWRFLVVSHGGWIKEVVYVAPACGSA